MKGCSYGDTEIGNVNRIGTAVANVLYASNIITAIYLSSHFVEMSSFFSLSFALLRKAINVLVARARAHKHARTHTHTHKYIYIYITNLHV